MQLKKLVITAAVGALAVGLVGTATAAPTAKPTKNVVEIAAGDKRFSTLVSLVQAAGLDGALAGKIGGKKITVFAPTNAAFKRVPAPILEFLGDPANKDALVAVLQYHVLSGQVKAKAALAAAKKGAEVETLQGEKVALSVKNKAIFLNAAAAIGSAANNAKVVTADIAATNGVIHVINRVILPPTIVDALTDAGLLGG